MISTAYGGIVSCIQWCVDVEYRLRKDSIDPKSDTSRNC
jgi:hypothetical protein